MGSGASVQRTGENASPSGLICPLALGIAVLTYLPAYICDCSLKEHTSYVSVVMEKFFENVYEGNFFQFYFYSDSKIRLGMIEKYLSF